MTVGGGGGANMQGSDMTFTFGGITITCGGGKVGISETQSTGGSGGNVILPLPSPFNIIYCGMGGINTSGNQGNVGCLCLFWCWWWVFEL